MIYGEVGRLTDEAFRQSVRLAETMTLLAVAVQYAWLDGWARAYRQATDDLGAALEREARRSRLIRQGVPPVVAGRGLHLV
jgi:hypothetical protein